MIDNDTTYSTNIEKANLFADYFSDQCSLPPPPPDYTLPPIQYPLTINTIDNVVFEVDTVCKIMKSINVSKATGPDGIGNKLLRECADSLAIPLTDLFNKSMSDGIFPDTWKLSHISPVYKKAFRYLKENYRPVSLLSCMSKVMERIVYNALYSFLKKFGLLTERNSGFKERDSTVNQLIHLCNRIYKGLDDSKDICLVFLDVSKAFDKVYHPALLQKLKTMGVSGNLLTWISSYLSDRKQKVVINGVKSDPKSINASVPQGSILGPLLFLVYVNDIVDDLETLPYLFADDTSLFSTIDPKNTVETFNKINNDLEKLAHWSAQWRVTFNAAKTVYMIISNRKNVVYPSLYLHGQLLNRVESHKHLGITFSSDMKWTSHIESILSKAFSRLNGIRRIGHVVSRKVRESLYNALVLPVIEYGSILYDNCSFMLGQRLERLHRQAAVVVTRSFRNTSYVRLLDELGWNNLEDRRKLQRFSLFKKMSISKVALKSGETDKMLVPSYLCDLVPSTIGDRVGYVLRNAGKLDAPKTRLVPSYNSFLPKTIREWNALMSQGNVGSPGQRLSTATSIDSFKAIYKREFFRTCNPFFKIDHEGGNVHHTRLRLGLSHLRAHLFKNNLISDPVCQFCNLEVETIEHYLLRCPTYTVHRVRYLMDLSTILEPPYVAGLNDEKIVNVLLYGDIDLEQVINEQLFIMAQTFIVNSKRFAPRILQ